MTGKTLFYPVWVSTHAGKRSPYCWGRPCDTIADARRLGRHEVDTGNASLALVVKYDGGERMPLPTTVYPERARKIVLHWETVMTLTDEAP